MARYAGYVCAVIAVLLIHGAAMGQTNDRARALHERQAARLQAREAARSSVFGIDPYAAGAIRCDGYAGPGNWAGTPPWMGARAWSPVGSGCAPGWGRYDDPWYPEGYGSYAGSAWPRFPGSGGYGYGYGLLPAPPNPYRDWARLWGRGWLDGEAVPPYHRFQYRFYPETLPDPTREGYVTAREWYGQPTSRPLPVARDCVRIEMDLGAESMEVFAVQLPALGAGTADALESVIRDRLGRGGGVVLRSFDGHVVRLPPVEAIRSLSVAPCSAPGVR